MTKDELIKLAKTPMIFLCASGLLISLIMYRPIPNWWNEGAWAVIPATVFTCLLVGLIYRQLLEKYYQILLCFIGLSYLFLFLELGLSSEKVNFVLSVIINKDGKGDSLGILSLVLSVVAGFVIFILKDKEEAINTQYEKFEFDVNQRVDQSKYNTLLIALLSRLSFVHTSLMSKKNQLEPNQLDRIENLITIISDVTPTRPSDILDGILQFDKNEMDIVRLLEITGAPRMIGALVNWLEVLPQNYDHEVLDKEQRKAAVEAAGFLNVWLSGLTR